MTDRSKRKRKTPGRSLGVVRGLRQEVRRRDIINLSKNEKEKLLRIEIKRRKEAEAKLVQAWREASRRNDSITELTGQLVYLQNLLEEARSHSTLMNSEMYSNKIGNKFNVFKAEYNLNWSDIKNRTFSMGRKPGGWVEPIELKARWTGFRARVAHFLRLPSHWTRKIAMQSLRVDLNSYVHYAPRSIMLPKGYLIGKFSENLPMISVVTPSFNSEDFIATTLHSVLDQNYPNLEYICQDGASTDRTPSILKAYESRLTHWASVPDSGQTQAINRGFEHATGEIMAWLNSDDLFLPGSLAYVAQYFAAHPEVDVVYGHRVIIDEHNREVGRWILPPHSPTAIKYADYIPQETMFWRRSLWEKVDCKLDESFRFAMDWDLILRFQEAGARFRRLPRFIGAFRAHAAQKSQAVITSVGFGEMDILRERALGYLPHYVEVAENVRRYKFRHAILNLRHRYKK